MKLNLDVNSIVVGVAVTLIAAGSTFAVGALVEFQDVKAKVSRHESQLSVVSQIVCKYAIRDKLEDADTICASVIHGK